MLYSKHFLETFEYSSAESTSWKTTFLCSFLYFPSIFERAVSSAYFWFINFFLWLYYWIFKYCSTIPKNTSFWIDNGWRNISVYENWNNSMTLQQHRDVSFLLVTFVLVRLSNTSFLCSNKEILAFWKILWSARTKLTIPVPETDD